MKQSDVRTTDAELSQFRVKGEIPVPALINWLTLAAVPLIFFYTWRSFQQDNATTGTILAAFSILLGINALVHLAFGHKTLQRRSFIILITALFSYMAIRALENGSAIIWLFAYPPIIFYISEARIGIIACVGGWIATLLLFSPLGEYLFETPYSGQFRLSMIIVLAFEMVTCYILDQSRRRSKLGLIKLAAEFEYAAKHDALTGLANRREALEQMDSEHERYARNGRGFSILLMDIDLFKHINDTYGHQVGDEIIMLVAKTLARQSRKVDTTARWGGEEFLVLLPETSIEEAMATAERIRQAVAAQSAEVDRQQVSTSISIGVAHIHGAESIDRLLQRADEALYQAKAEGRNRTCREAPANTL